MWFCAHLLKEKAQLAIGFPHKPFVVLQAKDKKEARMSTIEEEITKYESFVNERLRSDLRLIEDQQQSIYIQLNNYNDIKAFINEMKCKSFGESSLKTKIDLGSNFYVRCTM